MNTVTETFPLVREGKLFIDGRWVAGSEGQTRPDYNAATGGLLANVHQATRADTLRAVDDAYRAKDMWANMLVSKRADILLACADALAAMTEDVRCVLIEESGSTYPKAMFEVVSGIDLLRSAAGDARHIFGETLPHSMQGQFGFTVRRPLGVIAGIQRLTAAKDV
ncbi:aldehyde dehydrogenase family protein [Burkholderia pyrrocinia]|uniref:aldehyde dehydrogenase family protein n=1 Tax=Burkholderia pyrrocinia TaxID=60550 RepID=UPI002AAF18CB|nr:aldehyde dehydrogenase family protein [Burkholderia pyrrocinia]